MRYLVPALFVLTTLSAAAQNAQAPATTESTYAAMREAEKTDPTIKSRDYAGLRYYADADAALLAAKPAPGPRVLFFGDSITHNWGNRKYSDLFQRKANYINRGIGGQTTAQMLLRFRQDVLALHPDVMVLLGGTNDLPAYKVPDLLAFIESNIASMVELAQAHHIRVILCSVTPVTDAIRPQTAHRPPEQILALNAWIRKYATDNHLPYVDYYAALSDGHDRMQTNLTEDGLHPNHDGVARMEPLVEAAIADVLKKK